MNIERLIQQEILETNTTSADVQRICEEAKKHQISSVCVLPYWVEKAVSILRESCCAVSTVIGSPTGATLTAMKVQEAEEAICQGASDIEMYMNVGALLSGEYEVVEHDIRSVQEAIRTFGDRYFLKVIVEGNYYLSSEQIEQATIICKNVGVQTIKTCNSFAIDSINKHNKKSMDVEFFGLNINLEKAKYLLGNGVQRISSPMGIQLVKDNMWN